MRLIDTRALNWQVTALAGVIGGALVLLALCALYNLTLTIAARQLGALWQSGWALVMVVWGALWSQLALFVWPAMAGAPSAQACTGLSCLAIMLATFSAVTAPDKRLLPRALRRTTLGLAVAIALLGVPLALVRVGPLALYATLLGALVLLDLAAVAACLALAWKRGSREARSYVGAWALPMIVLAILEVAPIKMWFYGAGSQIVVLCAATWQALFLSVAISRASGRLRAERDLARRNEAEALAQARRDPLTGLFNRRGFLEAIAPMLDRAREGQDCFALLLLDVDRFKAINDRFGHDAGDEVLVALAGTLGLRAGAHCTVARLGGEEFALATSGLSGFALLRFADEVRRGVEQGGHGRHGVALAPGAVTVSIGLAAWPEREARARNIDAATAFRELYRRADAALYRAKSEGRNRVVVAPVSKGPAAADVCAVAG
nr:GGDEF domain-containing protein [Novosphingobium profundi]